MKIKQIYFKIMIRITDRINLLSKSCMIGDYDLAKFCIEHSDIDLKNDNQFIENAGYYGYYDIVELLLEHGANPEGSGAVLLTSKVRCHYKTHNLLKTYTRKNKLNKIISLI